MANLNDIIIGKSKFKCFDKGSLLHHEGKVCANFVFLTKGIIRHFFIDKEGNEITKNFIKAPAYFCYSLSSFISQKPGVVQCDALSDVELYEMNHSKFIEMLKDYSFLETWNNILFTYIAKKEAKEIALLRDNATLRYKQFLQDFPGLLNEIPHYYIASYLSISPETLSRVRKSIS